MKNKPYVLAVSLVLLFFVVVAMRLPIKESGLENTPNTENQAASESHLENSQNAEEKPPSESESEYIEINTEMPGIDFRSATDSEQNKIIKILNNTAFSRSYKFRTVFQYYYDEKISIEGIQRNLPRSFCPEDDGQLEVTLSKPYFYDFDVKINAWSWSYNLKNGETLGFSANADTERDMKGVGPCLRDDLVLNTNKFFIFDQYRQDIKEVEVAVEPDESIKVCKITFKDLSMWKNRVMVLKIDWKHAILKELIVEDPDGGYRFTTSFEDIYF